MSLAAAIARIEAIQGSLAPQPPMPVTSATGGATAPTAVTAGASSANAFSSLLNGAMSNVAVAPTGVVTGPTATAFGARGVLAPGAVTGGASAPAAQMVALAQREVGQAEAPLGSNDSPRIATYRTATAGSGVGPWCAYFVSWLGHEAGMPLGDQGQGYGRVDDVYAWAQRTGRAVPNGAGVVPRPGDLIVWDEHIGMVESVLPDGRIQTIEGNSSHKVSRNVHDAGSALGYVRMG